MASKSFERTLQSRYDNERRMTQLENRAHKIAFAKRLGKAIAVGLFAYITMVTGQVAGWIAIPAIVWSLCYGAAAVDKYMDWRYAPWVR